MLRQNKIHSFLRRFSPVCAGAALGILVSFSPAQTATPFDGKWSTSFIAEGGGCTDRGSFSISVSNGRVAYRGSAPVVAKGRVGADGRVRLTFAHARDVVNAKGSLRGRFGNGSWTSPTLRCSGTWTARKSKSR